MYVRTEEHHECALTVKLLQPGGISVMLNRRPLNTFLGRLVPRPLLNFSEWGLGMRLTQFSFYTAKLCNYQYTSNAVPYLSSGSSESAEASPYAMDM